MSRLVKNKVSDIHDLGRSDTKMPNEEWIKTRKGGRRVKFIDQELPEDGASITAQLEGNEVV
jgi:hypothetical protein